MSVHVADRTALRSFRDATPVDAEQLQDMLDGLPPRDGSHQHRAVGRILGLYSFQDCNHCCARCGYDAG